MSLPRPHATYLFWPQPQHRAALLRYTSTIPALVGGGSLNEAAPRLDDDTIERSLRLHFYRRLQWTGNQDPGPDGRFIGDSPVDLAAWQLEHLADRGGMGPTWACGPYSAFYVGLLALFGIPARRVWNTRTSDGFQDYAVEYWSRQSKAWRFVVPQCALEFQRHGESLSFIAWCFWDRFAPGGVTALPIAGDGNPCFVHDTFRLACYQGMSANPHVMAGNRPHAGGPVQWSDWNHWQVMAPMPGAMPFPQGETAHSQPDEVTFGTYDTACVTEGPLP